MSALKNAFPSIWPLALFIMVLGTCQTASAIDEAQIEAYNKQAAALADTRPILSALKSVEEAYAAVAEIREMAKDIVGECKDRPGVDMGQIIVTTGPEQLTGKYFTADPSKLRNFDHTIQKQQMVLAQILSVNQQDKRPLRASEEDRKNIELVRADARSSFEEMITDANKVTALVMAKNSQQAEVAAAAKDLIKATGHLEHKLKAVEHAMHQAQKAN